MTYAPGGLKRPCRLEGLAAVAQRLLDAAAHGELPGQPAEHEQHDADDDTRA